MLLLSSSRVFPCKTPLVAETCSQGRCVFRSSLLLFFPLMSQRGFSFPALPPSTMTLSGLDPLKLRISNANRCNVTSRVSIGTQKRRTFISHSRDGLLAATISCPYSSHSYFPWPCDARVSLHDALHVCLLIRSTYHLFTETVKMHEID